MATNDGRLSDLLRAGDPDRTAFVTAETGEASTYGELERAVASLAGRLATLGVGRGSRVAVVLPDGPAFLRVLLALVSAGRGGGSAEPGLQARRVRLLPRRPRGPSLLLAPDGERAAAREAAGERGRDRRRHGRRRAA